MNATQARGATPELDAIKADFFEVLTHAPDEVNGLRALLVAGRVDGLLYEGECACLIGSIANLRGCHIHDLPKTILPDTMRPSERWFLQIMPGDTPELSDVVRQTIAWIDEWAEQHAPTQGGATA